MKKPVVNTTTRAVVTTTTRAVGVEELWSGVRETRDYKTPYELMSGRPDAEDPTIYEGWASTFKDRAVDNIRGKWGAPGEDSIPD